MSTLKIGNTNIYPMTYAHYVYLADGVTTVSAELSSLRTALNNLTSQNSQRIQQITDIQNVIPTQATTSNKLADRAFVNSSIATNTANFVGKFVSVPALKEYSGTLTNNDYAFVTNRVLSSDYSSIETLNAFNKSNLTHFDYAYVINGSKFDLYRYNINNTTWELQQQNINKVAVSTLNTAYNRYKYNGTTWLFEYSLNNSSYTADQWNAINSGISGALVAKLNGIESGAQVNTVTSVNSKTGAVVLDSDDISDTSAEHKFVSQTQINNWNGKSVVSVSDTGTATDEINYITINGVERKIGSTVVNNVTNNNTTEGLDNYELIQNVNQTVVANATSPDFIQRNGVLYYKKIMQALTSLHGSTWLIKNDISFPETTENYAVNFTSNEEDFVSFNIETAALKYDTTTVQDGSDWEDNAYKTIAITDGDDEADASLIDWFIENATRQSGGIITITYSYEPLNFGSKVNIVNWSNQQEVEE